jgi:NAD(P)-dependent dehydrogenase (short-subunit alcohol dehydrogenase family)
LLRLTSRCTSRRPLAAALPVQRGSHVIVTGGAMGIGRAICIGFASAGADVLCADINESAGRETEYMGAVLAGSIKFEPADLSDTTVPAKLVAAARKWSAGRPVGVLVNNVGVQKDNGTPLHLLDEDTWDLVLGIKSLTF